LHKDARARTTIQFAPPAQIAPSEIPIVCSTGASTSLRLRTPCQPIGVLPAAPTPVLTERVAEYMATQRQTRFLDRSGQCPSGSARRVDWGHHGSCQSEPDYRISNWREPGNEHRMVNLHAPGRRLLRCGFRSSQCFLGIKRGRVLLTPPEFCISSFRTKARSCAARAHCWF
jgi:hypothetical protein